MKRREMKKRKIKDYEMLKITDDMSEETKRKIRKANNMAGYLNVIHKKLEGKAK